MLKKKNEEYCFNINIIFLCFVLEGFLNFLEMFMCLVFEIVVVVCIVVFFIFVIFVVLGNILVCVIIMKYWDM